MTPLRGAPPALPLRAGPAFAQSRRCHSNGVGCLSDPWLASVCAAGARAQRARRLTQARSAQRQSASVGDSTRTGVARFPRLPPARGARQPEPRLASCAAGLAGRLPPGSLRRRLARPWPAGLLAPQACRPTLRAWLQSTQLRPSGRAYGPLRPISSGPGSHPALGALPRTRRARAARRARHTVRACALPGHSTVDGAARRARRVCRAVLRAVCRYAHLVTELLLLRTAPRCGSERSNATAASL